MTKHILASAFQAVIDPLKKRPGPKPRHHPGMARSGELDEIADNICKLIRLAANNTWLTEVMRLRDREVKMLDRTRMMKVMNAYAEQKAKNDAWKRRVAA